MDSPADSPTSATFLDRLRHWPRDQEAWRLFVRSYGGLIYSWCRHWNLQEADAEDVTQAVMMKVTDKMQTFHYDPSRSFRGWLRTLAHHAWHDFLERRKRPGGGTGDSQVVGLLDSTEARDDLVKQMEEQFDRELLEEAKVQVKKRVDPHTWEAFCLLAVEGLSGAVAAEKLGMNVATVFVARSKVQKMLKEELRRLEPPEP